MGVAGGNEFWVIIKEIFLVNFELNFVIDDGNFGNFWEND